MERLRSLLLVKPDNLDELEQAYYSQADAIILDMRGFNGHCHHGSCELAPQTLAFLSLKKHQSQKRVFIRVSHPDTKRTENELNCVMQFKPEGVLLSRAIGRMDIGQLSSILSVIEAQHNMVDGSTRIIAISGETSSGIMASSTLSMATPCPSHRRLYGLSWDEIALVSEIRTRENHLPHDLRSFTRSMTLMAARAAKVSAFDTPSLTSISDLFLMDCQIAAQSGYEGKVALNLEQVSMINDVFA